MLVPAPRGAGSSSSLSVSPSGGSFAIARGIKGSAWVELQVARSGDTAERKAFEHFRDDSRFVSLEAMTSMHEPFARALPGFDLFLPRLYEPSSLAKLATELDAFARRETGPASATAREVASLARESAARGQSLWVLGP